jgi:LysR family transcriptional activator of nhaA
VAPATPWLNYNHLFYFFVVVTEGGVAPASRKLRLSHPTVSEQIRALEAALGETLFFREGRRLALTDVGRHVFTYAEDIFSLGQELTETLRAPSGAPRVAGRPVRLAVGVSDVVPKVIARRVLASLETIEGPIRLTIRQDATVRLLDDLARHALDVLITDTPAPPNTTPRVFAHALGECGTAFFAARSLASELKGDFPRCLDRAPFLLPGPANVQQHALLAYFEKHGVVPRVAAEIDDSALLKAYGEDGRGVFAGPEAISREISAHYNVDCIGRAPALRERFFLLTAERRIEHPLVSRLLSRGHDVFVGEPSREAENPPDSARAPATPRVRGRAPRKARPQRS